MAEGHDKALVSSVIDDVAAALVEAAEEAAKETGGSASAQAR